MPPEAKRSLAIAVPQRSPRTVAQRPLEEEEALASPAGGAGSGGRPAPATWQKQAGGHEPEITEAAAAARSGSAAAARAAGAPAVATTATAGAALEEKASVAFQEAATATSACDVLLWRKPLTAVAILAIGSLAFYHCAALRRPLVGLVADVLLVLACSSCAVSRFSRHAGAHAAVPDPLAFRMSEESANRVAACVANLCGAAEGVLRVAASGSDFRLFAKVVTVLYLLSVLGRSLSGATIAYLGLWALFVVPFLCSKLRAPGGGGEGADVAAAARFTRKGCRGSGAAGRTNQE